MKVIQMIYRKVNEVIFINLIRNQWYVLWIYLVDNTNSLSYYWLLQNINKHYTVV